MPTLKPHILDEYFFEYDVSKKATHDKKYDTTDYTSKRQF